MDEIVARGLPCTTCPLVYLADCYLYIAIAKKKLERTKQTNALLSHCLADETHQTQASHLFLQRKALMPSIATLLAQCPGQLHQGDQTPRMSQPALLPTPRNPSVPARRDTFGTAEALNC